MHACVMLLSLRNVKNNCVLNHLPVYPPAPSLAPVPESLLESCQGNRVHEAQIARSVAAPMTPLYTCHGFWPFAQHKGQCSQAALPKFEAAKEVLHLSRPSILEWARVRTTACRICVQHAKFRGSDTKALVTGRTPVTHDTSTIEKTCARRVHSFLQLKAISGCWQFRIPPAECS